MLLAWFVIVQVAVSPAEIVHLLEYSGLGYVIGRAAKNSRFISRPSLGCFVLIVLAGRGDDATQYVLPNRYFEM